MTKTEHRTTRDAMSLFQPDLYYRAVTDVDLDDLKRRGVRILLLDLDNTLVPRNTTEATPEVHDWIQAAKDAEFGITIVSNNWHERVQRAAKALDVEIVGKGTKPFPAVFRKALDAANLPAASAAVIGDQIFTDILGGKFLGSTTVLVVPLVGGTDLAHTRFLRMLERRILRRRVPVGRERATS